MDDGMVDAPTQTGDVDHTAVWRRRYVLILVGVTVVGLVAIVVGFLLARSTEPDPGGLSPWWALVLVVALLMAIVAVAGFVAWRVQSRQEGNRLVMRLSTPRTSREVGRALKAGRPLDERQRQIAQAAVDAWNRRRWLPWLSLLVGALYLVAVLLGGTGLQRWLYLFAGVTFVVNAALFHWSRKILLRRAARQDISPRAGA